MKTALEKPLSCRWPKGVTATLIICQSAHQGLHSLPPYSAVGWHSPCCSCKQQGAVELRHKGPAVYGMLETNYTSKCRWCCSKVAHSIVDWTIFYSGCSDSWFYRPERGPPLQAVAQEMLSQKCSALAIASTATTSTLLLGGWLTLLLWGCRSLSRQWSLCAHGLMPSGPYR